MRLIGFILLLGIALTSFGHKKPYILGSKETIHSKVLKEDRILNIYVPEVENTVQAQFNTIYLLDGSHNQDFIHIVGIVQYFELIFQIPPTIVIGIENTDRPRDFTFPTKNEEDLKYFPTSGGSDKFIEFLDKEVIPHVEKRYSVNEERMLIGQSFGGLLATQVLLKHHEMFSDYVIVSPSLWWDDESMIPLIPELLSAQKDPSYRVHIAVGDNEEKIMIKEAKKLYAAIKKLDRDKVLYEFELVKNVNHATIHHQAVYNAFLNRYPEKVWD